MKAGRNLIKGYLKIVKAASDYSTFQKKTNSFRMYLMYYMSEEGSRVYTLAKTDPAGNPTFSAHPAR